MIPLLEYFEEQADCVAVQVGEAEIEISLLGSYGRDAHDAAVHELVSEFRLHHPEARSLYAVRNGELAR